MTRIREEEDKERSECSSTICLYAAAFWMLKCQGYENTELVFSCKWTGFLRYDQNEQIWGTDPRVLVADFLVLKSFYTICHVFFLVAV